MLYSIAVNAATKDTVEVKNILLLKINYPLPESGVTFKTIYSGILNIQGGVEHLIGKRFFAGACLDYSYLKTSSNVLDINTKMNIISPSLNFGLEYLLCKKIVAHPVLSVGYSFINYTGTDADGNAKPKFTQQGTFIQPSLSVGYLLHQKVIMGLNISYSMIFQIGRASCRERVCYPV